MPAIMEQSSRYHQQYSYHSTIAYLPSTAHRKGSAHFSISAILTQDLRCRLLSFSSTEILHKFYICTCTQFQQTRSAAQYSRYHHQRSPALILHLHNRKLHTLPAIQTQQTSNSTSSLHKSYNCTFSNLHNSTSTEDIITNEAPGSRLHYFFICTIINCTNYQPTRLSRPKISTAAQQISSSPTKPPAAGCTNRRGHQHASAAFPTWKIRQSRPIKSFTCNRWRICSNLPGNLETLAKINLVEILPGKGDNNMFTWKGCRKNPQSHYQRVYQEKASRVRTSRPILFPWVTHLCKLEKETWPLATPNFSGTYDQGEDMPLELINPKAVVKSC